MPKEAIELSSTTQEMMSALAPIIQRTGVKILADYKYLTSYYNNLDKASTQGDILVKAPYILADHFNARSVVISIGEEYLETNDRDIKLVNLDILKDIWMNDHERWMYQDIHYEDILNNNPIGFVLMEAKTDPELFNNAVLYLAKRIKAYKENIVYSVSLPQRLKEINMLKPSLLEQRLQDATIMFVDISGFSAMSEVIPEEKLAEEFAKLNDKFYSTVTGISELPIYNGIVTGFQGDAEMIVFNTPVPQEFSTTKAVECAFQIQQAIREKNNQHPSDYLQVRVKITIDKGKVMAGRCGSEDPKATRKVYTALGEAVNNAAFMQRECEPGEVLISEAVRRQCLEDAKINGHILQTRLLGQVNPKGSKKLVTVHLVDSIDYR